jgi:hypothetical protein
MGAALLRPMALTSFVSLGFRADVADVHWSGTMVLDDVFHHLHLTSKSLWLHVSRLMVDER